MFIWKCVRFCAGLAALAVSLCAASLYAEQQQGVVIGNVRVEPLSDSLVRIELKGPEGFEDRNTFHVVNRDWPGAMSMSTIPTNSEPVEIITTNYTVRVPNPTTLDGVTVTSPDGLEFYHYDGVLDNSKFLPAP